MVKTGAEEKHSQARMMAYTALVVVMFVSVLTLCPAVNDWVRAEGDDEDIEYMEEIPGEILDQLVAEELERVDKLDENALMEEFGISKAEYEESLEALGDKSVMLVGDEDGNITVETFDSIDRGRAGSWYGGDHFFFGIDSVSWSAIKWWFTNECIDMLVNQMCQGQIDAVAIAEQKLREITGTIDAIADEISILESEIAEIAARIAGYETESQTSETYGNESYSKALASAESSLVEYGKMQEELDADILVIGKAQADLGDVDVAAMISGSYEQLERLSNILIVISGTVVLATDKGTVFFEGVDGAAGVLRALKVIDYLQTGNVDAASAEIEDMSRDMGKNLALNSISGELDRIMEQLGNEVEVQKKLRDTIDGEIEALKEKIEKIKLKIDDLKAGKIQLKNAKVGAEQKLSEAKENRKSVNDAFSKSKKEYDLCLKDFSNVEKKYLAGQLSENDYFEAKRVLSCKEIDYHLAEGELHIADSKVSYAKRDVEEIDKSIKDKGKEIRAEKWRDLGCKKDIALKEASKLKTDLNVAKSCAKAGAKAVAKASCKAAICATVIGAVISLILDIVMTVLIKYIEDHFTADGVDTEQEYGIVLKLKIFDTHHVEKTIKILWKKVKVCFSFRVPCFPRLDGAYAQ